MQEEGEESLTLIGCAGGTKPGRRETMDARSKAVKLGRRRNARIKVERRDQRVPLKIK